MIPTNRFDKVGAAILGYYPTTEKSQGDIAGVGNYQDAGTAEKAKYWNGTWRVDQNLGDRQRFFVRYSTYTRNSTYNNYFDNAFVGTQFWFYSKTAVFDHVYTVSPTMVLNSRYSYNRFIRGSDQPASAVGFDIASLGFSPQFVSQVSEGSGALPAHQPDRLHQQRFDEREPADGESHGGLDADQVGGQAIDPHGL